MLSRKRYGVHKGCLILHGRRAKRHAGSTGVQVLLNRCDVADAPANLDPNRHSLKNMTNDFSIARDPHPRAVQIDDVDAGRPGVLPAPGNRRRVVVKHGLPGVVTLVDADKSAARRRSLR